MCGERRVWSEVRVPTVAAEAARQVSRERTALTQEQTRLVNQMRGGWRRGARRCRGAGAAGGGRRCAIGRARRLPVEVQARLARAEARLRGARGADRGARGAAAGGGDGRGAGECVRQLVQLKGVATTSASVLLDEGLVWRAFRNRRQIGGLLGFAPTPYDSGESTREQGISRAGNARLQAISIQLAWNWVRWQPQSALTQWYRAHFGTGKRARRIGIVAVARKLVIALWRYVTTGVVPDGRGAESRVGRADRRRVSRALRVRFVPGRVTRPPRRRYRSHVSGLRLHSLWGPRACARARID